jgi:hypothetical protein
MDMLRDVLKLLLYFAFVVVCIALYLGLKVLLYQQGWTSRAFRYRRAGAPKVEIQTIFHGNTKDDQDQI